MAVQPRILVIDDDPVFRALIAGLLKNVYVVTTAESGPEGYRLALEQPPHVALIDVQMPGWDGIETLEKFRTHPELARIKTAILTSDASRKTVIKAIQSGADAYIVKTNFSRSELLQKLQSLSQSVLLSAEESARAELRSALKSTSGMMAREPQVRPSSERVENEWDRCLQGIIDHWE
jgi:CheY-like chemotaxis protein